MALWASPPELISTKPKPRGRPVNLSMITLADSTVPCAANISCSWPSVTEYGRPPTYNFLPMFFSYERKLLSLTLRKLPAYRSKAWTRKDGTTFWSVFPFRRRFARRDFLDLYLCRFLFQKPIY